MGMIGNAPYQGLIGAGNIQDGAVTAAKLAAAAAVGNLGFTPVNKAGDTMSGALAFGAQKPNQIGSIKTYRYLATVSQSAYATLLNSSGVAIASTDTGKIYRVRLVTTGTGTNTGVTYLAQNVDSLGWAVRKVSGGDIYSNTPGLVISGSVPKIATAHPSTYDIEVSVEELDGQNDGAHWGVFGLDSAMTANYEGYVTVPLQPSFCVYRQSTQNISAGGVIIWDSTRHNVGSCYNTSTGRFTAPIAGTYLFSAINNTISTAGDMLIRRNGSNIAGVEFDPSNSGGWLGLSIPIVLQLSQGDYVDVIMSTSITQGVEGNPWNCFSGHLLG